MPSGPVLVLVRAIGLSSLLFLNYTAAGTDLLGEDGRQGCPACPACEEAPQAPKCEQYTELVVQLRWLKSAQFAGLFAAEALGLWEAECLAVVLHQRQADQRDPTAALWGDQTADVAMPHYLQFLGLVAEGKDIMHVSQEPFFYQPAERMLWPHVEQHFRRGGLAMITSPVYETGKTRPAEELADLSGIKFGIPEWPFPGPAILSVVSVENMTACNYEDQEHMVPCKGGEDVEFQPMGFGIQALMGASEIYDPVHIQPGMTYDQIGQVLATPLDGKLPVEGEEFKVYPYIDSGVYSLEDGIMVKKSWLQDPANEATLVKFLKGMHLGWIYCRDNEAACVGFVSPQGEETHQTYQMREVNKLVWPAPNGIGVHVEETMTNTLQTGLNAGVLNMTLPFPEHTTNQYAILANKELHEEGFDTEGLYFDQPQFQARLSFCLNGKGVAEICPQTTANDTTEQSQDTPLGINMILLIVVLLFVACLASVVGVVYIWSRLKCSVSYKQMMMRRTPPGMLGTGSHVTMVITDIEGSTSLWDQFPDEMAVGQEMHDSCLRTALSECYGYEVYTEGDSFTVTFHEADDALKWCSLVQQRLQILSWPPALASTLTRRRSIAASMRAGADDILSAVFNNPSTSVENLENMLGLLEGQEEPTPALSNGHDFCGLRVRMGVHSAHVEDVQRHSTTSRVIYPHEFIRNTTLVQDAPCGGQIVLSADALSALTPAEYSTKYGAIVHLGAHQLEDIGQHSSGHAQGVTKDLFMLVPHGLATRVLHYPPVSTVKQVSLGYMQAPNKGQVTIVFSSIQHLRSIRADMPDEAVYCIEMVSRCARDLLQTHKGYECEERDGSFMLAFHTPNEAIMWALDLQDRLLEMEWSEELLEHPACERCMMLDVLMFNGPRVKIGMASGTVVKKVPSQTTGRADYFGPLLNHAARVKNHASGGQILVDKASWESAEEVSPGRLRGDCLGSFEFKGLKESLEVYQVSFDEGTLKMRTFPVVRAASGDDGPEQEDAKEIAGMARPRPSSMSDATFGRDRLHSLRSSGRLSRLSSGRESLVSPPRSVSELSRSGRELRMGRMRVSHNTVATPLTPHRVRAVSYSNSQSHGTGSRVGHQSHKETSSDTVVGVSLLSAPRRSDPVGTSRSATRPQQLPPLLQKPTGRDVETCN